MRRRRTTVLLAAAVAGLSASVQRAPAQDARAAADSPTPVVVGTFGMASADDLFKAQEDVNGKETADLARTTLDRFRQSLPPVVQSPDDRRFGSLFYVGGGLTCPKCYVSAIPMKAGSGTPQQWKAMGGQPVDGSPDLLALADGSMFVKRTAAYVVAAPSTTALKDATEESVTDGFTKPAGPFSLATPGTLLVGTVDLAGLRQAIPSKYAATRTEPVRQLDADAPAGPASYTAGRKASQQLCRSAMDHIAQLVVAVTTGADR